MVLNSLAISFFADLDNVAWKRLISTIPSVKAMQKELIGSVAKTHAAALGAIEERKLQTVLFTASSLIIYIVGTISYKVIERRRSRCGSKTRMMRSYGTANALLMYVYPHVQ